MAELRSEVPESRPNVHLLLPGDLATATGGYIYDRRICEGLLALGWGVQVHSLDASFPLPSAAAQDHARKVLAGIPSGSLVLVDGLALGGMPALVESEGPRLQIVGLVHHPLADETGLDQDTASRLRTAERQALAGVRKVFVTSPSTAAALAQYDVRADRIEVVLPGTDPAPLAVGSGGPGLRLLCVASLTPRKGHTLLLDALSNLTERAWTLVCAGSMQRDPATAATVRRRLEDPALAERVTLLGELDADRLEQLYHEADLFVLATYHEGYGMALAEALARGLPVLSTRVGAVPDTVPAAAGMLVPPGNRQALTAALAELLDRPDTLAQLTRGARNAREQFPTWEDSSQRMADVLGAILRS